MSRDKTKKLGSEGVFDCAVRIFEFGFAIRGDSCMLNKILLFDSSITNVDHIKQIFSIAKLLRVDLTFLCVIVAQSKTPHALYYWLCWELFHLKH